MDNGGFEPLQAVKTESTASVIPQTQTNLTASAAAAPTKSGISSRINTAKFKPAFQVLNIYGNDNHGKTVGSLRKITCLEKQKQNIEVKKENWLAL